jgi:hypothetical protein
MSDPNQDREEQFRRRAYELWQQAGRPDGRHHELWHQASAEGAGQTLADAGFFDEAPRRTSKRLLPHRQKVDGKPTLKSLHRSAEGFTSQRQGPSAQTCSRAAGAIITGEARWQKTFGS